MSSLDALAESMAQFSKEFKEDKLKKGIKLGIEIHKVQTTFYYKMLIEFLKGEGTDGDMYLGKLKPLYDEFGYETVNKALIEFDLTEANNEQSNPNG